MTYFKLILTTLFFIFINTNIYAQYTDDKNPNKQFYTTETKHFKLIFPISMKKVVENHLQVIEDSYDRITKIYGYKPTAKTTMIIRDEDISNGWAAASINNFSIWPTASEYLLRGTHNWQRDVIAHEFSHIITISPSFRFKPFIPDARLGYVSSLESQKFFTVASGIFPFSTNPMWFLEGIAQYSSFRLNGDKYDSHRQMILRSDAINDNLLTLNEMRIFSKNALGGERVYDHGFSLVKYIVDKYSLKKIADIIKSSGSIFNLGFYSSFEKKTGDKLEDVYKQWADSLKIEAKIVKKSVKNIDGEQLFNVGFYNVFPYIKDNRVWFKSTLNTDYGPMSLVNVPIEFDSTGNLINQNDSVKVFKVGVNYSYSLSSDSSYYLYSKTQKDGSNKKQLYIASKKEIKKGKIKFKDEKKLKKFKRVIYTAINPKNDSIFAYIMAKPGYNIIGVANVNGEIISKTDTIYTEKFGTKIDSLGRGFVSSKIISADRATMFGVNWLDSTQIIFSYFQSDSRDIGVYDFIKNRAVSLPINTNKYDERDPFCYNGNILYSSDVVNFISNDSVKNKKNRLNTRIFNIYSYNIKSGKTYKITDVLTGAFMPNANDSILVFSMFGKNGYEIRLLKNWNKNKLEKSNKTVSLFKEKIFTLTSPLKIGKIEKYSVTPSNYLFSPMLFSDMYGYSRSLKVGASAYFFDPLMRFNIGLFGAYDVLKIGERGSEYDVGVVTELKTLPWTISIEVSRSIIDSRVNYRSTYNGELGQDSIMYKSMQFGLNNRYQFKGDWEAYKMHLFGSYNTSGAIHYNNPLFNLNYNFYTGLSVGLMLSKFSYSPSKEFGINPIGTFAKLKFALHVDSLIFKPSNDSNTYDVFYITPNGILKTRNSGYIYPSVQFNFTKYFKIPVVNFLTGGLKTNINLSFINDADSIFHNPNSGFSGISAYPLKKDSTTWGYSGMYNFYFKGDLRFPIVKHADKTLGLMYINRIYGSLFGEYAYSSVSTKDINYKNFLNGLKGVGGAVRMETTLGSSYPWYLEVATSVPIESMPQISKYIINIRASMSIDKLENIESPFY